MPGGAAPNNVPGALTPADPKSPPPVVAVVAGLPPKLNKPPLGGFATSLPSLSGAAVGFEPNRPPVAGGANKGFVAGVLLAPEPNSCGPDAVLPVRLPKGAAFVVVSGSGLGNSLPANDPPIAGLNFLSAPPPPNNGELVVYALPNSPVDGFFWASATFCPANSPPVAGLNNLSPRRCLLSLGFELSFSGYVASFGF